MHPLPQAGSEKDGERDTKSYEQSQDGAPLQAQQTAKD